MTIPEWLQAIQNYMKTLQYPSDQGLSRPSLGTGMMIASLVAALSPPGQQMLSEVGEAGHGGMPRCESLEEVTLEDVTAMIRPSPFISRVWAGAAKGSGATVGSTRPTSFHLLFLLLLLLGYPWLPPSLFLYQLSFSLFLPSLFF